MLLKLDFDNSVIHTKTALHPDCAHTFFDSRCWAVWSCFVYVLSKWILSILPSCSVRMRNVSNKSNKRHLDNMTVVPSSKFLPPVGTYYNLNIFQHQDCKLTWSGARSRNTVSGYLEWDVSCLSERYLCLNLFLLFPGNEEKQSLLGYGLSNIMQY